MKFVLIMCVLTGISAFSQARASVGDRDICAQIKRRVQVYAEHQVFQGNVLLSKQGRAVCEVNVGWADIEKQVAFTSNARFPIASLSKPVMATLLVKLQEQGKVDLDASLSHYLPDFSAPWAQQVTLHDLLANRSGLPSHFSLPGWQSGRLKQPLSNADLLEEIAQLSLRFAPSEDYLYTNLGWFLLGEVVETVLQHPLEESLRSIVLAPLGMRNTGFIEHAEGELVTGYRWALNAGWQSHAAFDWPLSRGGAGLYASARDLASFLHGVHSDVLLTTEARAQMFLPQTPYGWRTDSVTVGEGLKKTLRSYDGQMEGHSSLSYYLVEDELSLVLLSNNGTGFAHKSALADDILSVALGQAINRTLLQPSFALHKSLIEGGWAQTLHGLKQSPLEDLESAALVKDLAQQLNWSGHKDKAAELYDWLSVSLPANASLAAELQQLCESVPEVKACGENTEFQVGMSLLPLVDEDRKAWRSEQPRPVDTHVFFPTRDTDVKTVYLGPRGAPLFEAGSVVYKARPAAGKRPLVLMSHGTGGSALQMLWLAEALVKAGYVVAAVNHHGNTAFETNKFPEGFLLWWERARDLQVVHQKMLAHPEFKALVDPDQVAVIGFSLGGYTALSSLGGITDKALFDQYCDQNPQDFSCQAQPEFADVLDAFKQVADTPQVIASQGRQHHDYRLPSLKAAVVIAPAIVHAFREKSLQAIQTPTLFIVGSEDKIAPGEENAQYAHTTLPNSAFHTIHKGHHYSFLSSCTDNGKKHLKQLCGEPHGVTRASVQAQAISTTLAFLKTQFGKKPELSGQP